MCSRTIERLKYNKSVAIVTEQLYHLDMRAFSRFFLVASLAVPSVAQATQAAIKADITTIASDTYILLSSVNAFLAIGGNLTQALASQISPSLRDLA